MGGFMLAVCKMMHLSPRKSKKNGLAKALKRFNSVRALKHLWILKKEIMKTYVRTLCGLMKVSGKEKSS